MKELLKALGTYFYDLGIVILGLIVVGVAIYLMSISQLFFYIVMILGLLFLAGIAPGVFLIGLLILLIA